MRAMRFGKWRVDRVAWPGDVYPPYCSGMAYVMSTDVAVALHRASYSVPFFWIDDVYLTGIVAKRIGLAAVRHVQFAYAYTVWEGQSVAVKRFTGSKWHQHVFWHFQVESDRARSKKIINAFRSVWRSVTRLEKLQPSAVIKRISELCRVGL